MSEIKQGLPPVGAMDEWVRTIYPSNPELGDLLYEERGMGFKRAAELGLPMTERLAFRPLSVFLANADEHLASLRSKKFYVNLPPAGPNLELYRDNDLSAAGVKQFIEEHIPPEHIESYGLTVGQYFDNVYGGSIVINPSGKLALEMIDGPLNPLSAGEEPPKYRVERDQYTGYFHCSDSLQDPELIAAVQRTLGAIPATQDESEQGMRSTRLHPGYYEFAIVQKEDDGPLEPVFFDYNPNPAYYLSELRG